MPNIRKSTKRKPNARAEELAPDQLERISGGIGGIPGERPQDRHIEQNIDPNLENRQLETQIPKEQYPPHENRFESGLSEIRRSSRPNAPPLLSETAVKEVTKRIISGQMNSNEVEQALNWVKSNYKPGENQSVEQSVQAFKRAVSDHLDNVVRHKNLIDAIDGATERIKKGEMSKNQMDEAIELASKAPIGRVKDLDEAIGRLAQTRNQALANQPNLRELSSAIKGVINARFPSVPKGKVDPLDPGFVVKIKQGDMPNEDELENALKDHPVRARQFVDVYNIASKKMTQARDHARLVKMELAELPGKMKSANGDEYYRLLAQRGRLNEQLEQFQKDFNEANDVIQNLPEQIVQEETIKGVEPYPSQSISIDMVNSMPKAQVGPVVLEGEEALANQIKLMPRREYNQKILELQKEAKQVKSQYDRVKDNADKLEREMRVGKLKNIEPSEGQKNLLQRLQDAIQKFAERYNATVESYKQWKRLRG